MARQKAPSRHRTALDGGRIGPLARDPGLDRQRARLVGVGVLGVRDREQTRDPAPLLHPAQVPVCEKLVERVQVDATAPAALAHLDEAPAPEIAEPRESGGGVDLGDHDAQPTVAIASQRGQPCAPAVVVDQLDRDRAVVPPRATSRRRDIARIEHRASASTHGPRSAPHRLAQHELHRP